MRQFLKKCGVVAVALTALTGTATALGLTDWSEPRIASLEENDLKEFDSINVASGRGCVTSEPRGGYSGPKYATAATLSGLSNKYARGQFDVNWQGGSDNWYGMAVYLPCDFYEKQQGDVDILRWDNYSLAQRSQDQSGVTIRYDGKLAMLFKNLDTGEYTNLITPASRLAVGKWHWIEARQKLGGDGAAVNELRVNGRSVGSSTTHNYRGRPATMLRFGLVAESSSKQTNPLTLYFDRASASPSELGPVVPGATP